MYSIFQKDFVPQSPTQLKIQQLHQELRKPDEQQSQFSAANEINTIKQKMKSDFQLINQRLNSTLCFLKQVENQENEVLEDDKSKKNIREYHGKIQEIEHNYKEYYEELCNQNTESYKALFDKILELKIQFQEQEEKIHLDIQMQQKQLQNTTSQLLRNVSPKPNMDFTLLQMKNETKIKTLKRKIEEDYESGKQDVKLMKKKMINLCEKIEHDVKIQQQALKQSFQLHFEALQKLVKSITATIE